MSTLFRFLQLFSLGTWVGAILFFSAIVAPAAFTVLTREQAGNLVSLALGRLHLGGMLCGVVYLGATAAAARTPAALLRPAPLFVVVMIVLTFISQFWVSGSMAGLRGQMASLDVGSPALASVQASFDRLHRTSVRLEVGVLVAGLVALVLSSRRPPSP
jgi:hypothetical protein